MVDTLLKLRRSKQQIINCCEKDPLLNIQKHNWQEGLIDGVIIRPTLKHKDSRGWLAEIFRSDEIDPGIMPVMSYVSVTAPGVSRGPHAHKTQTDTFAFLGPGSFIVKLWDNRANSPTMGTVQTIEAGQDNPVIVTVPPGIVHGYRNISEIDAWVINCPNQLFAGKNKKEQIDEIRYEDLPDSPFEL